MSHQCGWTPKRPEVPAQCASCPFRVGNDKEFGEVLQRLKDKEAGGPAPKVTKRDIGFARLQIWGDTHGWGDFYCHGTVYTPEMQQRPVGEWMQCKGAADAHRNRRAKK